MGREGGTEGGINIISLLDLNRLPYVHLSLIIYLNHLFLCSTVLTALTVLSQIPTDRIHEVEIPTGLPLIFDLERKCVKLLEDSTKVSNSLSTYNFGTSPDLLFRPCDLGDDDLQTQEEAYKSKGKGIGNDKDEVEEKDSCYLDESGQLYAYDPIIRLPVQISSSEEEDDNNLDDPLHSGDRVEGFDSVVSSSADSALL